MRNTLLSIMLGSMLPLTVSAQFYTVTQGEDMCIGVKEEYSLNADNKADTTVCLTKTLSVDSITKKDVGCEDNAEKVQKSNGKVYLEKGHTDNASNISKVSFVEKANDMSELTIPNLYAEIKRNGIAYPDIVLAQAILETGWFRSSACRKKNNLFGLTNPRTGKYYEFGHWKDSVRAYYSMVQRKYKGGNYLLWLRKIGYAEDKNYIRSVIKVLKMLS